MFQANISQQQVIEYARRKFLEEPVYLDTETTGLEKNDEIVEIAVIDKIGNVLINTLIKPRSLIPDSASSIHHITNEMVKEIPRISGCLAQYSETNQQQTHRYV